MHADRGDVIGSMVTVVGVCIILFWPRVEEGEDVSNASNASVEFINSPLNDSGVAYSSVDASL